MGFQLKPTKHKVSTVYKSLYIREELAKQVEQCLPYVGYPRSLNAMGIIDEVAQNMENR